MSEGFTRSEALTKPSYFLLNHNLLNPIKVFAAKADKINFIDANVYFVYSCKITFFYNFFTKNSIPISELMPFIIKSIFSKEFFYFSLFGLIVYS